MLAISRTDTVSNGLADLGDVTAEARIDRRAAGNAGDSRNRPGGVSELRIEDGRGHRMYFARREADIVIRLRGGDKRTQQADIAAAQTMVKEIA